MHEEKGRLKQAWTAARVPARRFMAVITKAHHLSLSWPIHKFQPHFRNSHAHVFPSGFQTKTWTHHPHPQSQFSLNWSDPNTHPHKTSKIIVLYILVFIFDTATVLRNTETGKFIDAYIHNNPQHY
jgi:hypothetical protein